MGGRTQLYLLLWKNFALRKRQKVRVFVELLWPLFLFLILVWVRTTTPPSANGECHYRVRALPSAGLLPWLQGTVCELGTTCVTSHTPAEAPGEVNNYRDSLLSRVLVDTQGLLMNDSFWRSLETVWVSRTSAMGLANVILTDPRAWTGNIVLQNVLVDSSPLQAYMKRNLSFPDWAVSDLMAVQIRPQPFLALSLAQRLSPRALACNTSLQSLVLVIGSSNRSSLVNLTCSLSDEQLQGFAAAAALSVNASRLSTQVIMSLNRTVSGQLLGLVGTLGPSIGILQQQVMGLDSLKTVMGGLGGSTGFSLSQLMCGSSGGLSFLDNLGSSNTSSSGTSGATTTATTKSQNSSSTASASNSLCANLISMAESSAATKILWKMFKPFLLGKIPYTPDTPAVRAILQQANTTFEALAMLGRMGVAWDMVSPALSNFFSNSSELQLLRGALASPMVASMLDPALSGSGFTAAGLSTFLSGGNGTTWRSLMGSVGSVLHTVSSYVQCLELNKFEGQANEGSLVNRSLELLGSSQLWAALVFPEMGPSDPVPRHLKYKIRMDIDSVEVTNRVKDRVYSPGPRNESRYLKFGFAFVQDMVERAAARLFAGGQPATGIYLQQMPYPCYVQDSFLQMMTSSLPLFMTLAWIYSVAMILKGVVHEKEARLKETMRMMGLTNGLHWLGWFISCFIPFIVSAICLILILKFGNVFPNSSFLILLLYFVAFTVATIMQCFLVSTFFARANLAAACGGILYFLLYLPYVLCNVWQDRLTFPMKILASLLSTVSFGFGSEYISQYEQLGVGSQPSNLRVSTVDGDRYSLVTSIIMMFLDALLYGVLTWYIENVFPGQYGVPRRWYFLFTRSYWCGASSSDGQTLPHSYKPPSSGDKQILEEEPGKLPVGVSIQGLVKVYDEGKKLAVDGLTLNFYQGQITSFLGHNGAGKTTTMSILTGLFPPTSGTAYMCGKDIRTDMDSIRKSLGMCPQHNVLFENLTVEEHIWFYARMKGCSEEQVKQEMPQMILDVGLPHKKDELSKNLSGGMQRKLSVAIAFVGGSQIVILDEPTAGVDPYARRGIWNLLLKYRHGRTIILSTHHMDEADLLGDRVAIISHGRLRCCGSSLFLKNAFGAGYYLTMVKSEPGSRRPSAGAAHLYKNLEQTDGQSQSSDEGLGSESGSQEDIADVSAVTQLLQQHVPDARLVENFGQELTYVLPYHGAKDGAFALLFKELDEKLAELGVSSYGVSDTTLEEIFLKVAEETGVDTEIIEPLVVPPPKEVSRSPEDSNWERRSLRRKSSGRAERALKKTPEGVKPTGDAVDNGRGSCQVTGQAFLRQQFRALFIKRFHFARRSRKGFVAQIVLPAAFVCLALIFSSVVPPFAEYPSLELHQWLYGAQFTFVSNDAPGESHVNALARSLTESPGFGTRCMNTNPIPSYPCPGGGSPDWTQPAMSAEASSILQSGNWSMGNPSPACQCSTQKHRVMFPDCPEGAGGAPPMQRLQNNTDTLQNLTAVNITDHILKTLPKYYKTRHGGISVGDKNGVVRMTATDQSLLLARFGKMFNLSVPTVGSSGVTIEDFIGTRNNLKVWFNSKAFHAPGAFTSVASNAVLRAGLPAGADPSDYGITAFNHPLNLTKEQLTDVIARSSGIDVVVAICVIFAMSFVPASFVLFLIQERVSKAKHLQFVSGVNPAVYWICNFVWDMCNYAVPTVIVIVIFLCFQKQAYVSAANLPVLILLLFLYGWSITPLMYPASFIFSVPSTAYVVLTCINLFIGINGSVATFVLELIKDQPDLQKANDILRVVLLIFPHFCLGRGLMDLAKNQQLADIGARFGQNSFKNPFEWDVVGKNLFAMAVEGVVFFTLTLLIQYRFFVKPRPVKMELPATKDEDEDVARERQRIASGGGLTDSLRIVELVKIYRGKKKAAVDRVSVGIPPGECFGLLGVNGAGKTTMFKMLTGDTDVTSGEAFLTEYSILNNMREVHQNMGYCPQFDAINDLITGREHLEFYARLRGVPEKEVATVAEWGIRKLGLIRYGDRSAGSYSGGNKRKLSTAMALIGCPPVVFLDEPTTGMDPKARRFLWDCILSVIKEGRCVLLTSHSMEECEALCTRMSIMVNGRFQCLGSVQHLKNKFGDGYTVTLRVAGSPPVLPPVEEFIDSAFPGSLLKERHHNMLQYQLPSAESSLAKIFNLLALRKEELNVEDYSVSQTTLDEVFVSFAKHQHDGEEWESLMNQATMQQKDTEL
ncbi:phospholipid-transporting ATPase ABCA1-like [Lampetra fluviatilis]